ncbi:M23 family metallopeptidase [Deinococcus sp. YIM 77859]|uniref:LysM peptidoglycan-binding domain-containing M23 family metallopeptidase n=1 Tax=Deinococcus sp. YIM 77859 TaxID=1540221 RepID=UPI000554526D|nr:M23 family metallopeptidase [Deinococcus sp. YIM 77859]
MRRQLLLALVLSSLHVAAAATVNAQPGDTLNRLAVRYGTTPQALARANPTLPQGALKAGTRVTLPPPATRMWTVRPGDTLSAIARREGTTVDALVAANRGLNPQQPLQVGQKLTLPSRLAAAPRSAATPVVRPASIRVTPVMPVTGRLTTPFRDGHEGVDLAAPSGTPIRAAAPGVVTESRFDARSGWGWTVVVDHGNGLQTRYSHNSANLVPVGRRVEAGQVIGRVGSTGNSTGPHLDYRVTVQEQPINPFSLD